MTKKKAIQLFEEHKVCTVWDGEHGRRQSTGEPVEYEKNLWQIEKK